MAKTVTLPLWLILLLGVILVWAVADRIIVPFAKRLFSRWEEQFLEKVKARFHLLIPAFKVTRRRTLIERLVSDPRVLAAADAHCRETGLSPEVVLRRVRGYAEEIIPGFHAFAYYYLGSLIGLSFARLLYRVRRVHADEAELARIPPASSLVFLMNHRSHVDSILLGFLTLTWAAPSFAVGEWAMSWPLRPLIRALGGYLVRRGSGNPLYRKVLAAYVQMAVDGGQVQAVYLEGKLTLDGSLQPPRTGILEYIVRGFDPEGERDVVFVPVGVNYDRVLEDRTLVLGQVPGSKRKRGLAAWRTTLRFIGHNLLLMLRGGWHRFGYAVVSFGRPVSLKEYVRSHGIDFRSFGQEARGPHVCRFGKELLEAVGRVIPVLPVSLVSKVFAEAPERTFGQSFLKQEVEKRIERFRAAGALVYLPRRSVDYTLEVGLRTLLLRHLVIEDGAAYKVAPGELPLIRYYANSVAHLG
jgi:glycerol-3-phosphate O-acyltransferase